MKRTALAILVCCLVVFTLIIAQPAAAADYTYYGKICVEGYGCVAVEYGSKPYDTETNYALTAFHKLCIGEEEFMPMYLAACVYSCGLAEVYWDSDDPKDDPTEWDSSDEDAYDNCAMLAFMAACYGY